MRQPPLMNVSGSSAWWQRLVAPMRRLRARADWTQFAGADWAEAILQMPVTDDFHAKQGRSTGRLVLENAGRELAVYLKRHYRLPWWRGLLATLWPRGDWSPALQEYRHLRWAHAQGLPVPQVVAAGEYLHPLGKLQSFLAIEELRGMLGLHQAIPRAASQLQPAEFRQWKAGLVRELARLTRFLHRAPVLSQGLVSVPFLCSRIGYAHAAGVARSRSHDRFSSPGPPSADQAMVAREGFGSTFVFLGFAGHRRP